MKLELLSSVPLVCPRCRRVSERGLELHTLALARRFRDGVDGEVMEGELACAGCPATYPIVDGIPIVLADPTGVLRGSIAEIVEGDIAPETAALLCSPVPDEEPYPLLLDHLSTYLDAHWGDRSAPPPDGPGPRLGMGALVDKLAGLATAPVDLAVELGCSVGRGLAELSRGARLAVGVDLRFGSLRRARRLLAGEEVRFARRRAGRHYEVASAVAQDLASPTVMLVCADAVDPPFCPEAFDRVMALNVLDNVCSPAGLLTAIHGLCRPGGELILTSPYAWQSGIVDEDQRLGTVDPAAEVRSMIGDGTIGSRCQILEEQDIPWSLRRDSRSQVSYLVHYLRVRRSTATL